MDTGPLGLVFLRPMREAAQDDHLMERAADGCHASFEQLVVRHQDGLFRVFRSLGLSAHDSEDCVQETLLRLLRAAPAWRRRAPLRGFLALLARHSYADWCRRQQVRRRYASDLAAAGEVMLPAAPVAHAERLDLRAAVLGLSARLREVVELGLREGLSQREIGVVLDIPEGTVKSRMFHAVRHLRRKMCRDLVA